MDFSPTPEQEAIRAAVRQLCRAFDGAYWRETDAARRYPDEFVRALTEAGWLACLIPQEYGGSGLGLSEAGIVLEEVNRSGGNSAVAHAQMYVMGALLRHGSEAQKQRYLPGIASGELRLQAFGVTEPDAGSETTAIKTFARRVGDDYVINGQKVFISRAEHSDLMLLLARTTPYDELTDKTRGLSLFLVDLRQAVPAGQVQIQPLDMMINHHSTQLYINDLVVPAENLVGREGEGFRQIIDGWNAERILIASQSVGDGDWFIDKASRYASERVVFGRPIGANQGVQFPIARVPSAGPRRRPHARQGSLAVRQRQVVRRRGQLGKVPREPGRVGGRQRLHRYVRWLRLRPRLRRRAQVPRNAPLHHGADQQQHGAQLHRPARPAHAPQLLETKRSRRSSRL